MAFTGIPFGLLPAISLHWIWVSSSIIASWNSLNCLNVFDVLFSKYCFSSTTSTRYQWVSRMKNKKVKGDTCAADIVTPMHLPSQFPSMITEVLYHKHLLFLPEVILWTPCWAEWKCQGISDPRSSPQFMTVESWWINIQLLHSCDGTPLSHSLPTGPQHCWVPVAQR